MLYIININKEPCNMFFTDEIKSHGNLYVTSWLSSQLTINE